MNDTAQTEQFRSRILGEKYRTHVVYYLKSDGDGLGSDEDLYLDGDLIPDEVVSHLPADAYMFAMYRQLVVTITCDGAAYRNYCQLEVSRPETRGDFYIDAEFISFSEAVQHGYRGNDFPSTAYLLDRFGKVHARASVDVWIIRPMHQATTG